MQDINEQVYIRDNFPKLVENYHKYAALVLTIKTKKGRLVRFLFNRMQKRLWQWFVEDLVSGKPIRWYVTKSRQQGSTSWFLGLMFWLLTTRENQNALFLAHDETAAKSLGLKVQYLYARSKLKPEVRTMNREQIHFAVPLEKMKTTGEVGLDCIIDVATGDSSGIGISRTYQWVLITEFGTMPDVGIDVPYMLGQLAQCVTEEEGTGIFIETTAKGENYAKDFWDDEKNGYRKIFIPWVASDDYRVNLPLGKYPKLSSNPSSKYGDEVEEFKNIKAALGEWYEEFKLLENDRLGHIRLDHEAYCRIVWRRRTIDRKFFGDYSERRAKFKQEYPTTVHDAFSTSSKTIFSLARILEREEQIRSQRIKPVCYTYDQIKEDFYQSRYGNLRIYEPPNANFLYAIGGDASQGLPGGDESACVVLKLPSFREVASFNDIIPPPLYARMLYTLGKIYNNALLAVELNDKGGYAAIQFLVEILCYPNLYFMDGQNPQNIRYGWATSGPSKDVMISDSKDLIQNQQTTFTSSELIKQLKNFVELKPGIYGGIPGKPDDLVMAYLIAIQCARAVHIPRVAEIPKVAPKGSPNYIYQVMSHQQTMRQRFSRATFK